MAVCKYKAEACTHILSTYPQPLSSVYKVSRGKGENKVVFLFHGGSLNGMKIGNKQKQTTSWNKFYFAFAEYEKNSRQ